LIALTLALAVLAPLVASLTLARASLRGREASSPAARVALYAHAVIAALAVPVAIVRALPGALVWRSLHTVALEAAPIGRAAFTTLGPALALPVVAASFLQLCRAPLDRLPGIARRSGAWLIAAAILLLVSALAVTPDMKARLQVELVLLARGATLDPTQFFQVRAWTALAWSGLAAAYALGALAWARAERA
jgi:hypothetical protein